MARTLVSAASRLASTRLVSTLLVAAARDVPSRDPPLLASTLSLDDLHQLQAKTDSRTHAAPSSTLLLTTIIASSIVASSRVMRDPKPESLLPLPTAVFHILIALADRDRHGYSIMQDVAARTDGKVQLNAGTLYSSIRRMLEQGLIEELAESPDPSSTDERRRYYRLARFGKRVAAAEVARLNALVKQARATGLVPGV